MKKSDLIKLLELVFNEYSVYTDSQPKSKNIWLQKYEINSENKLKKSHLLIKCYTYQDISLIETESCNWYFFIDEDYLSFAKSEYLIPNTDTLSYLKLFKTRFSELSSIKSEFKLKLNSLRKLKGSEVGSELRDFKLTELLDK